MNPMTVTCPVAESDEGWSKIEMVAIERLVVTNRPEKANLHRNYVFDVERGARNISLVNIIALAKALGAKPGKLF